MAVVHERAGFGGRQLDAYPLAREHENAVLVAAIHQSIGHAARRGTLTPHHPEAHSMNMHGVGHVHHSVAVLQRPRHGFAERQALVIGYRAHFSHIEGVAIEATAPWREGLAA